MDKKVSSLPLKDRYVVLTGDLKSSRKLKALDRARIQENLKKTLTIINKKFASIIIAKFIIVQGDGFQGMISSSKYLFNIYYVLFENIAHQFYLGVGIGSISTDISKNVGEIDGEAFHKALNALEQAKKENEWIVLEGSGELDGIITNLLNFMVDVMWNWTKRQREIVIHYKKMKSRKADLTLEEIAKDIGIKKQTVSKILRRSKYKMIERAEKSFVDFVSQN